ncbi:methionine--tRNA ligase [Candidatus Gracilibacteria bacterium]|nr:MAG: methionine--tRNA ligase [Candidatus Gracilibacteria bacterium]
MKKPFFITTPIYYGNGIPHIGHAYSSILADVIARYKRGSGYEVRFSTGIDENSQKTIESAKKVGIKPMDFLDDMSLKHKKIWEELELDYTDFIRTTEKRHFDLVSEVLQKCYDSGDIYKGVYEGMYCNGCEAFKKKMDLIDYEGKMVCPDHLKEPEEIKENNYFFKLTKYETWLKEFYDKNPDFLEPHFIFNKIKDFVYDGLEDFSISRENAKLGIPLPFDKDHITYVWFDALFNYYTVCRYSKSGDKNNETFKDERDFFPPDIHVVGKDIIRFHAIYWPAMLASYFGLGEKGVDNIIHYLDSDKLYLPKKILSTGFLKVDGQKMSKSLGNVIDPVKYIKKYNKDLLTLSLLGEFGIGFDGNYDKKNAILKYNAKLSKNLGNLLNRVVVLAIKVGGKLEKPQGSIKFKCKNLNNSLYYKGNSDSNLKEFKRLFREDFEKLEIKNSLDHCFSYLNSLNLLTTEKEPWVLMKTDENEAKKVLFVLAEGLRQVGLSLYPFFPKKMGELFISLGLDNYVDRLEKGELEVLINEKPDFVIEKKSGILYPQFEV